MFVECCFVGGDEEFGCCLVEFVGDVIVFVGVVVYGLVVGGVEGWVC